MSVSTDLDRYGFHRKCNLELFKKNHRTKIFRKWIEYFTDLWIWLAWILSKILSYYWKSVSCLYKVCVCVLCACERASVLRLTSFWSLSKWLCITKRQSKLPAYRLTQYNRKSRQAKYFHISASSGGIPHIRWLRLTLVYFLKKKEPKISSCSPPSPSIPFTSPNPPN